MLNGLTCVGSMEFSESVLVNQGVATELQRVSGAFKFFVCSRNMIQNSEDHTEGEGILRNVPTLILSFMYKLAAAAAAAEFLLFFAIFCSMLLYALPLRVLQRFLKFGFLDDPVGSFLKSMQIAPLLNWSSLSPMRPSRPFFQASSLYIAPERPKQVLDDLGYVGPL